MELDLDKEIIEDYDFSSKSNEKVMEAMLGNPHLTNRYIKRFIMNTVRCWRKPYFIDGEIRSVKQLLSDIGLLFEKEKHKGWPMFHFSNEVFSILLSDNLDLINRFLGWDYGLRGKVNRGKEHGSGNTLTGYVPMLHFLLRGEIDKMYQEKEFYIEDRAYKRGKEYTAMCVDGVIAIAHEDADGLSRSLDYFLSTKMLRKLRRRGGVQPYLYSLPANILLKTAWIRGMEIEVDHPMVLMDMMPIRPLDKYEVPYFFLEGYEGEVPQSWLDYVADNPEV